MTTRKTGVCQDCGVPCYPKGLRCRACTTERQYGRRPTAAERAKMVEAARLRNAHVAEARATAIEMWGRGAKTATIGRALGVSGQTARKYLRDAGLHRSRKK